VRAETQSDLAVHLEFDAAFAISGLALTQGHLARIRRNYIN